MITCLSSALWRTVKYEEMYLKPCQGGGDAEVGLTHYFGFYNTERPHQALAYLTPAEVFTSIPVEATSGAMVESSASTPLRMTEPNLDVVPVLS